MAPVPAIPLDLFRILAGLVLLWYFSRRFRQAEDFSAHNGLIDHELCLRIFPPTRLGVFHPKLPDLLIRGALFAATLASLAVIAGFHPRLAAGFMFVVAVSAYRWNLLVVYIDDGIMHLLCLWLVLMPVGTTLNLTDWLLAPTSAGAWLDATVPGGATRAFMANMAFVYVVAGSYKFTSPMWRNGSALNAILKMPIALTPDFWQPRHAPFLRLMTWSALILEPIFALIFVLPTHHPLKWALVVATIGFHLGIMATMKIPFANAGMIGAIPLALSPEIMGGLRQTAIPIGPPPLPGINDKLAIALISTLVLMILWEVGKTMLQGRVKLWQTHIGGFFGNPWYVVLWIVGIAQSYRLFDWIDDRNWHVRFEILRAEDDDVQEEQIFDPEDFFPKTLRHLFLQSYLVGNVWLRLPKEHLRAVQRSLLERHAARFAKAHPDAGTLDVFMISQQITSDNLDLRRGERRHLMRCHVSDGQATVLEARTV